jgi:PKD repeat protein
MSGVRVGRAVFTALCGCALALTGASPAWAAPTWLAPVPLSPALTGSSFKQQVAFDDRGDAIAVWVRTSGATRFVEAAVRPAGSGGWQAPTPLSREGERAEWPDIAIDARGDATVTWEHPTGSDIVVESVTRPAGSGVWQAPVPLSGEGQMVNTPELTGDPQGDTVAAWTRQSPAGPIVEAASRPAGSAAWQPPIVLSPEGQQAEGADVALDAQGDAMAVWKGQGHIIEAATKQAGSGAWQVPVALSDPAAGAFTAKVAVDQVGDAVAVWLDYEGGHRVIEAAVKPAASGVWQAPVSLSSAGEEASEPQVAVDPRGQAIVVWETSDATNNSIEAAVGLASSGAWQPPTQVSVGKTSLIGNFPQVAVDEAGDAVAVWDQTNGSNFIIEAAARPGASGVWQPPVQLSPAGEDYAYLPQVAVDRQGNAVAVWEAKFIEVAGYDAAGPSLEPVAIPSIGRVGQPLTFSVSPFDSWSILGQTIWSFGDGAGATGTNVTHVYTASGEEHVTVTSVDALGNSTSATATVTVTPCSCRSPLLLGNAHLTNRRFRVARQATAISSRAPLGTRFAFTLSAPAAVRITITRSARGVRGRRGCVAPTAALVAGHAKRCNRTLTLGTLTRASEPVGADSIFFSGRMGRHALSPRIYKARLQARGGDGLHEEAVLSFRVVS